MELDLDTFLVTVYCVVADEYAARYQARKPRRPGAKPRLADCEVVTLMALAQWQPHRSERRFVAYARAHWRAYFPALLSQSAFNRRARDLWGVLAALGPAVAARLDQLLGQAAPYAVVDGVPVPLARRCRGRRQRLFTASEADVGRGGSDHDWYYGVRLLAVVSAHGAVTGWVLGPASTGERWLLDALLRWRHAPAAPAPTAAELAPVLGPTHHAGGQRQGPAGRLGPRWGVGEPSAAPLVADLGFAGAAWEHHWQASYGAVVLHKDHYAPLARPTRQAWTRWLCHRRQGVETAFQWLGEVFGLAFPRARTYWGLLTRIAAKLLAFNLAVYVNHGVGRPPFAFFQPLD